MVIYPLGLPIIVVFPLLKGEFNFQLFSTLKLQKEQ